LIFIIKETEMARKEKTIHYIYKTTCNVTGRWYIGMHSTNNLEDGYMGSGLRLRRSIRKYGLENHTKEILEFFEARQLLIEAEKKRITPEMLTDKNCMNLMGGGKGGFISEEQQKHRSICAGNAFAKKYKEDEIFREEVIKKRNVGVIKAHKDGKFNYNNFEGKKHSDKSKEKMSESSKGKGVGENNSQHGTMWIHCKASGEVKKIKKEDWFSYQIKSDCIWELGRK
jgi:hypothetical protein